MKTDRFSVVCLLYLTRNNCFIVFTARCYASAVLAMGLCLSVCLSVSHKSVFYRNG